MSPVRETPIYEQLRGEGINADVESSAAAPHRGGRPGRHRRLADTTGPVTVCTPPGPGADRVAHQHPVPQIADQPPGATQQTAAVWGPRAALPHPAHARPTRAPAASRSPTATGAHDPAQAPSDGSADPKPVARPRQDRRTDDSPTATPLGEFRSFDTDYGPRDQPSRKKMTYHTDTDKKVKQV
jgi:hypothetical protein